MRALVQRKFRSSWTEGNRHSTIGMSYSYSWSSGGCGARTGQWTYSSGNCQPVSQRQQPSAPSSSSSIDAEAFAQEMLEAHNEYRTKHQAPPLKLNKEISNFSMNWARTIAARNTLQHSQGSGYGENICYMYDYSARKAVDLWYDEVKNYAYGTNHFSMSTGHFTQVVWKDSKELGVGWAISSNNAIYIVANYSPPGNYAGRFVQNVLPPIH